MAKDYRADVRRNNEIIAKLEAEGSKAPDAPLGVRYTLQFTAKFGGKKRTAGNSGKCGKAGRRTRRLYLGVGSGPEWTGPPRTK